MQQGGLRVVRVVKYGQLIIVAPDICFCVYLKIAQDDLGKFGFAQRHGRDGLCFGFLVRVRYVQFKFFVVFGNEQRFQVRDVFPERIQFSVHIFVQGKSCLICAVQIVFVAYSCDTVNCAVPFAAFCFQDKRRNVRLTVCI